MEQKNSISNYIANLHEVHVHLSLNLHNIWNCDHSQLKYYKWVSEEWSIYTKTYHISKSTPGYFFLSKKMNTISVSSVESLSCVWHFVNPLTATWTPWALGLPVHHQLPEFTQTHVHWVGDAIQSSRSLSSCPLLLLPSIFPSIRVFSNDSALCIRWPKYWSFSFNISLSNEHPGLISFRMDWFDLLAV